MFAKHEDISAKCMKYIEIQLWLLWFQFRIHWSRQGAHDFSVPIFWDRLKKTKKTGLVVLNMYLAGSKYVVKWCEWNVDFNQLNLIKFHNFCKGDEV